MKIIKHRTIYMKSTSSVPKGTLTSDSIVTSISNTPSDSKIPSEKAVKDALDAKLDTVTAGTNVSIDKTNPKAPVINVIGGGGAAVNVVTSIPLDGSATDLNVPSTKAVATEITKINSNLVALENIATGYKGLGFKSGDNTVDLKTPEINLGLNDFTVEIWARTEGASNGSSYTLLGASKSNSAMSSLKIVAASSFGINGIEWVYTEGGSSNYVPIKKSDSTKNLHHIVITRQGTLVTATINGRLIKSVTQDRVLDFSQFVFDIANTTYFSIGRVFNYAMSQDEAVALWNGGRVDEVVLDRDYYNNSFFSIKSFGDSDVTLEASTSSNYSFTTNNGVFRIDCINDDTGSSKWCNLLLGSSNPYPIKTRYVISFDYKSNKNIHIGHTGASHTIATFNASTDYRRVTVSFISEVRNNIAIKSIAYSKGDYIEVSNLKITKSQCLLELLPQNIHSSGIYNTGSLGSSHDAVLSKPSETVFIKEPQYKNRASGTGAPNYHPIAMGQEYYNVSDGAIYKASIPPVSREWSVGDWKQINM